MVLDVVNFGLFDGSTADHCWELGLVFNPKRLLTIWGPRSGEVSCSRRGGNTPAVPPRVTLDRSLMGAAFLNLYPGSSL